MDGIFSWARRARAPRRTARTINLPPTSRGVLPGYRGQPRVTHRFIGSTIAAGVVVAVFSPTKTPAASQTPPAAIQARTLPRTPDGKPNLSGIWQVMNAASWDIQDHAAQKRIRGGQGVVDGNEIPYQPAAAAKKKENDFNDETWFDRAGNFHSDALHVVE